MQDEGVLAKILVEAHGNEVKCGEPIALTVESPEDYQKFLTTDPNIYIPAKTITAPAPAAPATPVAPVAVVASSNTPSSSASSGAAVKVAPSARFLAQSNQLDLHTVKGTGKGGMIVKGDVVNVIRGRVPHGQAQQSAAPAPAAPAVPVTPAAGPVRGPVGNPFTDIPNSTMRKVIAKRLTESKQGVPHAYTVMECNIDSISQLRKRLKQRYDITISVNDLVIKAAALALRDVPEANARWNAATQTVQRNNKVDISVAVATPNGLITPIVTTADQRSVVDINGQIKDLATRAKAGKLKPEEFQGGSFSVSNLGMFGVSVFSAVINPPQACILAVGAGIPRVVPPTGKETAPKVTTTVSVQLSADRRVVDEATAAQFLQAFKYYLGDADALLL